MSKYKKLSEYGVIGNTHTAALISNDASVDWLCTPRFDSPSIFASILDSEKGGKFHIKPIEKYESNFQYEENTNILVTTFNTKGGRIKITDFMPVHIDKGGNFHVSDELHRIVECESGEVEIEVIFNPIFNYAKNKPTITKTSFGLFATDGVNKVSLSTNSTVENFLISKGDKFIYVLSWNDKPKEITNFVTSKRLGETREYWQSVVNKINYSGKWRDEVRRSFLILHLLMYSPTGAIVAATTTSLPERIKGPRNWDYRYSWVRDATFTLKAFFAVGDYTEALEYFGWLSDICEGCGIDLKVMYGISKKSNLTEETLEYFEGYKQSNPVRTGNAAEKQLQLDILGEVVDAAFIYHTYGGEITPQIWKFVKSLVNAARDNWKRKDKSIWEVRSEPHNFLISKVFCWVALDRGIRMAESLGFGSDELSTWRKTRDEVKKDVLAKGFNSEVGSFTQHYDTKALDASTLLLPLVGFITVDDPKMLTTIDAITSKLRENNFLHRYLPEKTSDGLEGGEGVFLAVNFWLIQNLVLLDRKEEAEKMYERLLKTSSPLGIFSEMVDSKTGEMLGNLPQALTHIEVILTAYYLDSSKKI